MASEGSILHLRSLQVTAPLAPNQGVGTILKRLAKVAGFYASAAVLGAAAVLVLALLSRVWDYLRAPATPTTTPATTPVPIPTPNSLPDFSPMMWLFVVWGVLTVALIIVLIYRSTLTMQEDDQLFLDDAESHMQQEQTELLGKVRRLDPVVRTLGFASGAMIVVLGLFLMVDYLR
jgi:hypothetical protein